MNNLNLLTLPINAYNLIEASAGTGKTFTISHLYLRLIVKPQKGLLDRPLTVDEILVVTFTNAATEELKDRIRAILVEALEYVDSGKTTSPFLKEIMDDALAYEGKAGIKKKLRYAVFEMDDAAVFTIHGFCQRVLSEYSFLSAQVVEQNLVTNPSDMLMALAQRLWRESFYDMDKQQAGLVKGCWKNPDDLKRFYQSFLQLDAAKIEGSLCGHQKNFLDDYNKLIASWSAERKFIQDKFAEKGFGTSYSERNLVARFLALDSFVMNSTKAMTTVLCKELQALRQSVVDEKTAKTKNDISADTFILLDKLSDTAEQIKRVLLQQTQHEYRSMIEQHKQDNGLVFFDDLIERLSNVLGGGDEIANDLKQRLKSQFPVALIDEFQDTDDQQYGIFKAIYSNDVGNALLMIGDPKQAIYSFRGADIYTYFKARSHVDLPRHFTLGTNWRSHPDLVSQINQLFSIQNKAFVQADFPEFIQIESPESFSSMQGLQFDGATSTLSIFSLDSESNAIDDIRLEAAKKTAAFIQGLIETEQKVNGEIIEPRDIAILVREGKQAKLLQEVFSQYNINSIYLSKDSVLNSVECHQFLQLVEQVLDPFNESSVSTALANPLIGKTFSELTEIKASSKRFFSEQQIFIEVLGLWQKSGFLTMWQKLCHHYSIEERLLGFTLGERALTNLNQVAEIFQQQTAAFDHVLQQFEHFRDIVQSAVEDDDYQRIRLDSEDNLVQIVTMHKSKGLEYPIVCCPFLFEAGKTVKQGPRKLFNVASEAKEIYWQIDDEQKQQVAKEQFSEDIRLLYVALTRAKYHLNFCWGMVKNVDKSALWHLFFGQEKKLKNIDDETFWQAARQLSGLLVDPVLPVTQRRENNQLTRLNSVRSFSRILSNNYIARSYSALLIKGLSHNTVYALEKQDEILVDNGTEVLSELVEEDVSEDTIFHFPKGSDAGNFMHQVLENIDFSTEQDKLKEEASLQLDRYGFSQDPWLDVITEHFFLCLHKQLPKVSCSFSDLNNNQVLKEMAFHLNAKANDGVDIARLLSRYRNGASVGQLNSTEGMFKGFIDLLFEYQGKYYVLDYKSNFLGFSTSDYSEEKMKLAIEDHQYDLQYLIYLAALQRLLKSRIPGYNYDQHIGGVYYLFLRGINNVDDAGIYFTQPSRMIIDAFEQLFFAAEWDIT